MSLTTAKFPENMEASMDPWTLVSVPTVVEKAEPPTLRWTTSLAFILGGEGEGGSK